MALKVRCRVDPTPSCFFGGSNELTRVVVIAKGYYLTQIEHVRDQTIKTSNSAKLVETAEATVRARNTPSASGQAENTLLGGARALANLHRVSVVLTRWCSRPS